MSEEFFLTEKGAKTLEHKRNVFYQTPGIKEWFYKENEVLLKNLSEDTVVLDIGCGLGTHLLLMSKAAKEVVGIDQSDAVLKRTLRELKSVDNAKVFKMNARKLEFPDNCFDQTVCMFNTLGNMNDEVDILREMKRVTKKGGRIIFSLYNLESVSERIEFYRKSGMTNVAVDGTTIRSNGKFFSKSYSEEEVKELCNRVGLTPVIHRTTIGFICEAVKN